MGAYGSKVGLSLRMKLESVKGVMHAPEKFPSKGRGSVLTTGRLVSIERVRTGIITQIMTAIDPLHASNDARRRSWLQIRSRHFVNVIIFAHVQQEICTQTSSPHRKETSSKHSAPPGSPPPERHQLCHRLPWKPFVIFVPDLNTLINLLDVDTTVLDDFDVCVISTVCCEELVVPSDWAGVLLSAGASETMVV